MVTGRQRIGRAGAFRGGTGLDGDCRATKRREDRSTPAFEKIRRLTDNEVDAERHPNRPPARHDDPDNLPSEPERVAGPIAVAVAAAPDRDPRPPVDLPRAVAADDCRLLVDPEHDRSARRLERR